MPTKFSSFLGINNKIPKTKLLTKDGAFLADAVNIDVQQSGSVKTRKGYSLLVAINDPHSVWNNYFVAGDTLWEITGDINAPTIEPILTGLKVGALMSYTYHNKDIYCTNGDNIWKLGWGIAGIDKPNTVPTLSYSLGGSLSEGLYQVCICYVNEYGEKSPTTAPVSIHVENNSILEITNIPQKASHLVEVYITPCNGTNFYRAAITGVTTVTIPSLESYDVSPIMPETFMLERLPPGQIIRSFNGRLFVASGNVLYYSEPWSVLYNPLKNYVPFSSEITLLEPCNEGIFISSDKTYWYTLDSMKEVLPYAAVKNTGCSLPDQNLVCWMSQYGLIIGQPNGVANNVQQDKIAVKPAISGATLIRDEDGMQQIVSVTNDPSNTLASVYTYMDAEIVHTRSAT